MEYAAKWQKRLLRMYEVPGDRQQSLDYPGGFILVRGRGGGLVA